MITDEELARASPLLHASINPFGRYRFDLERMRLPMPGFRQMRSCSRPSHGTTSSNCGISSFILNL